MLPWPFQRKQTDVVPVKRQSGNPTLGHFVSGVPPPHARVDPKLKLQESRPVRVVDLWKYAAFVASKATSVSLDVLSHHIYGPRKRSWGIQMTLITSLMRDTARHSALVDIGTIRMVMSLSGYIPLPADALVTPVTFRVRKHQLRGFLADLDAQETGLRKLSGEWIVGKRLWQRLQAEWKTAKGAATSSGANMKHKKDRVVYYIHGGAYYLSSPQSMRLISIPLSKFTDARVFALDYRLAPESQFPGPLHDVVVGYMRLVEDLQIPPENIVIAGDSAGGGLSLALLMYLRDNDYPMPSGGILMSPWVDLTMSCESWDSNAPFDVVPVPVQDDSMNPIFLYLGENMEKYITHPYASPLFGDFKGLPPLLIQAGDAELLRDEITLLAHKATLAGVEVRHELYEDAVHVFQQFPFLDAAARSFLSCRDFVRNTLPKIHTHSPADLGLAASTSLEKEIDNNQARLVRGDGVVTAEGLAKVNEQLAKEPSDTEGDSAVDSSERERKTLTSWGLSQRADSPTPSSTDEDSDVEEPVVQTHPRPPVRRIQSAFSLKSGDSSASPRHHSGNPTSTASRIRAGSLRGLTPLTISPGLTTQPPSPSIRRNSISHRDITALVQQWTTSGPANETVTYKPK